MIIAMGGRIAEEAILEKIIFLLEQGGPGSDINQATKLAKAMVMKYGMSDELGPVEYGENEQEVFLGRSVATQQNMSEEMARKVDLEVRKLIDEAYGEAKRILTEKIDDLHKLAKALLHMKLYLAMKSEI